ncbi:alpha-(1,3)-fucosyltransferase C-like [Pollicipes pollicipes]|uniref:alpha-(1,3)-fucosyltransferase C-like n=1 Tax=Pollicipes pollicipes TaxID=41117 RepID=UPI0018859AE0|nr:alpha-(1,3)-fucosyltransferase C-like [Pollicipes pollicipes]
MMARRLLLLALLCLCFYMLVLLRSLSSAVDGRRREAPSAPFEYNKAASPQQPDHQTAAPKDAGPHLATPPITQSQHRVPAPVGQILRSVAPPMAADRSPDAGSLQRPARQQGSGAQRPSESATPSAHELSLAAQAAGLQNTAQPASMPAAAPKLKHILYWNEFYGSMEFTWGAGQRPFIDNGCEVNTCFGTNDRELMPVDEYDAILFHVQTLPFFDWPRSRRPHQRYVFVTLESAQYLTIWLQAYESLFNVTLTYRRDSDFPYPYGALVPVLPEPPTIRRNYALGKTKLVAWFVSHCQTMSSREWYVHMLRKYIPVDIYGACGTLQCPRSANQTCHNTLLNKDYKFYLSFENSICNDYVTEKLFDTLKYDVVPIVLGGSNYSSYAPPGSYIEAMKYSPKELAEYLLELDKNDAQYNKYFEWKGKYRIAPKDDFKKSSFCGLCKYLHSNETKAYHHLKDWWTKGQCKKLKRSQ